MPEQIAVEITPDQGVRATVYPAAKRDQAGVTLILGHGAGAGQTSGFMVSFATGLAARGIDAVTFNFLYTEQGRRVPDPNGKLEACYRAVIEAIRHRKIGEGRLAIGGKSMGGRIASQVAAGGVPDVAGLVYLGYPLHPPGKNDQLRRVREDSTLPPEILLLGARHSQDVKCLALGQADRFVPHSPTSLSAKLGPRPWICVRSTPSTA